MRQLRAARSNVLLLRYNILLAAAIVFILAAVGFTYLRMSDTKAKAEATIASNDARSSTLVPEKEKAVQFRANLQTAKQILDREVTYTKVVLAFAKVLPSGVVIDSLNLDSQTFGTPTTVTAHAKDYSRALALKDSFQKSAVFSDVHFESISTDETDANAEYPVTVNLSVTINKSVTK